VSVPEGRCAGCGYFADVHDLGTWRCPQETADKNGRRGTFKPPAPPEPRKAWFGLSVPLSPSELKALSEAVDEAVPSTLPPQVPARPPYGPAEFAGGRGNKQGVKLGRHAIAAGWDVRPLYWRSGHGVEGCGLWLAKAALRGIATWKRPPGHLGDTTGWAADIAYAWRTDVERFPTKLNHTDLERLIA
jgi:hypothetical protein